MEKDNNQEQQKKALAVEEKIIAALKTVYDPEIPVNIYDLGLIYKIDFLWPTTFWKMYVRK